MALLYPDDGWNPFLGTGDRLAGSLSLTGSLPTMLVARYSSDRRMAFIESTVLEKPPRPEWGDGAPPLRKPSLAKAGSYDPHPIAAPSTSRQDKSEGLVPRRGPITSRPFEFSLCAVTGLSCTIRS